MIVITYAIDCDGLLYEGTPREDHCEARFEHIVATGQLSDDVGLLRQAMKRGWVINDGKAWCPKHMAQGAERTHYRNELFVVFTRTGGKRHVTRHGHRVTLCGREHMGVRSPSSGSPSQRYQPHMAPDICGVCRQEVQR